MALPLTKAHLHDAVTKHIHSDFTRISDDQTVAEAIESLRARPASERVMYLYVVDAENRLVGVVPTRRILLAQPGERIADLMIKRVVAIPADATVLDACEFFIEHRFLAFPVVDENGRMLGVVDVELYQEELIALGPVTPVKRLLKPITRFMQIESASGIVLLACAAIALFIANSRWAQQYHDLWHVPIGFKVGNFVLTESLQHWINDGLMTIFFFVIGLEIKREILFGELKVFSKAMLPVAAALGGMIAPALIYASMHIGQPTIVGWGIPTATDIAFVVGFLALLGSRVPHSLKIMLLTLAIADDLGATVIIGIFYSSRMFLPALAIGVAGFAVVVLFRAIGVRRVWIYALLGAMIWFAFFESGIHPTVAGVMLGLLTPARAWLGDRVPIDLLTDQFRRLGSFLGAEEIEAPREAFSPLERLEQALHPWVAFFIMPLFALANAGVEIDLSVFFKPVTIAVAAGLVIGKPIGIVSFSWLATRLKLAQMPAGIDFKALLGAGSLAGIGFTMSLFVAGLAMKGPPNLPAAKLGILGGSCISATLGCCLLVILLPRRGRRAGKFEVQE
jgi:NhaA family Na+:H+ antiporter